jgi:hypothetical protein
MVQGMTDTTDSGTGAPSDPSSTEPDSTGGAVAVRRYRPRAESVRDHRVTPRFTVAELSAIRAAADAAQMTLTGFCALAALAVARRRPGEPGPVGDAPAGAEELAELQRELFAARTALNRTGVNLNQAVAGFKATGTAPVWLHHAVDRVTSAVAGVDAVAARIHRLLS